MRGRRRASERARSGGREKKRKGAAAETQERSWNARDSEDGSLFCSTRGRVWTTPDLITGSNRTERAQGRAPTPKKTIGLFCSSLSLVSIAWPTNDLSFFPPPPLLPFRPLSAALLSSKRRALHKTRNSPTLATHGDGVEGRQRDGLLGGLLLPAPAVLRPFPLLLRRRRRRRLVSLSSGRRGRARRGSTRARRGAALILLLAAVVAVVGRGRGGDEGAPR